MTETQPSGAGMRMVRWRGAIVPGICVALWLALVDSGLHQSKVLVPLHQVLMAPFIDPQGRELWAALAASLVRVLAGFAAGGALGVLAGVALGLSRRTRQVVSPTVHGLRQIALFAWIPLLTAWFGNGEAAKLVFIAMAAFFPAFLNTEQGVRTIAPAWWEVAYALRLPLRKRLVRLVLPAALPAILVGLEMALLIAWIATVGAEYAIGMNRGIGSYLATAREHFRMDLVLAGVTVLALVGYGFSKVSHLLFNTLIIWRTRK